MVNGCEPSSKLLSSISTRPALINDKLSAILFVFLSFNPIFFFSFSAPSTSTICRIYLKNNCLGCNERISSEELVMRTTNNVFHLKCFTCVVCGAQLKKGEQYVVKQSQLFCRNDYEKEVEMLKGFNGTWIVWPKHWKLYMSLFSLHLHAQTIIMPKIYFHRKLMGVEARSVRAPFWIRNNVVHSRHRLMCHRNHVARYERIWPKKLDSVCVSFRYVGEWFWSNGVRCDQWQSILRLLITGLVPKSTCQSEENPEKEPAGCQKCRHQWSRLDGGAEIGDDIDQSEEWKWK